MGTIDTKEKFEAKRMEMAKREWARMKESDSIGCRNCHSFESMDIEGAGQGGAESAYRSGDSKLGKPALIVIKG